MRQAGIGRFAAWIALFAAASFQVAACSRPAVGSHPSLTVRRGDFKERLLLSGEVRAVRTEGVTVPMLPTWQTSIRWMATDGATVARGERVVELDSTSFTRNLEELRLTASRAENELKRNASELEAKLADKQAEVGRKQTELEKARAGADLPEGLLALRERQERELALAKARIALDKAENDLRAQEQGAAADQEVKRIALEKALRALASADSAAQAAVLTAPRDGVVLAANHPWEGRKIQTGDMVWVGMIVANLPDLTEMQIEAQLSDVDDGRVVAGMPAEATLDAWPELRFGGRVLEVSPVAVEPAKQSLRRAFRVRIALDRVDAERMRPGMSARVEIETRALQGVLLAPREALRLSEKGAYARLDPEREVELELGPCNARECVVERGLAEGAALIVGGRG